MNAIVILNGQDVTDSCRLQDSRILYDSSKRITTASLTIMGRTFSAISRYDYAHYGQDYYSIDIGELFLVTILDGRDGTTKLFEGQISAMAMEQTDAPGLEVFYRCELNDYAIWLDRSPCWGGYTLALPASDAAIIKALLGHFAPRIDAQADVATVVPSIQAYDWKNKTCRQVVDEMAALAGAEWHVDFNGVLHYRLAANAPAAPFALSTSPDEITSFPARISGYKQDFSNPVNRCYVRGAIDPATGAWIEASYSDPVSVAKYGEYAVSVVDDQITTAWDAALRAKATVLRYAYPVESGNFTVWGKDGLALGQQVSITEDSLGISGTYVIRSLTMHWIDQYTVQYEGQFGASRPDLETLLRLLDQRTRWKTSVAQTSTPGPGSITDANIKVPPGLSAAVIGSINANTIVGLIQAGQIGSVNAGVIAGTISAGQIATVNATAIQGVITAGQIGSVNATTIQGVIVSSQLADQIISDLGKFATALRPVPMLSAVPTLPSANYEAGTFFYYIPNGHFYQITPDGLSWTLNDNPAGTVMTFYHIGAISASSIIGLIVAAQIQTITAGQITGQVSAAQIGSVNASSITGQLTAGQIASVNANTIQGTIAAGQITSISAGQITGTLAYNQIGSINAATITIGLIQDGQISTISGGKLVAGSVTSDKIDTFALNVGGGGSKPGRINVYNGSNQMVAQIGTLDAGAYGGWFQVFGAAGTGYNDAKVKTDISGNLYITNANFNITTGQFTLAMGPQIFDGSYGSLAVQISGSGDSCSLVSRGLVIYNAGGVKGALVRDPSQINNVQLVLYNSSGGIGVLADGYAGTVRVTGNFNVGGNAGQTETVVISGISLRFIGGIYVGH